MTSKKRLGKSILVLVVVFSLVLVSVSFFAGKENITGAAGIKLGVSDGTSNEGSRIKFQPNALKGITLQSAPKFSSNGDRLNTPKQTVPLRIGGAKNQIRNEVLFKQDIPKTSFWGRLMGRKSKDKIVPQRTTTEIVKSAVKPMSISEKAQGIQNPNKLKVVGRAFEKRNRIMAQVKQAKDNKVSASVKTLLNERCSLENYLPKTESNLESPLNIGVRTSERAEEYQTNTDDVSLLTSNIIASNQVKRPVFKESKSSSSREEKGISQTAASNHPKSGEYDPIKEFKPDRIRCNKGYCYSGHGCTRYGRCIVKPDAGGYSPITFISGAIRCGSAYYCFKGDGCDSYGSCIVRPNAGKYNPLSNAGSDRGVNCGKGGCFKGDGCDVYNACIVRPNAGTYNPLNTAPNGLGINCGRGSCFKGDRCNNFNLCQVK